jgi:hypothetical protein
MRFIVNISFITFNWWDIMEDKENKKIKVEDLTWFSENA